MKGKSKVILSSALAITISASVIAGSTFALFTSESSVNVAITSGKVSVTAVPQDLTVSYDEQYLTGNMVEAEIKDNKVTLDKMTPGETVSFKIVITDNSTVDAKYRVKIDCTSGYQLMSGLNVTVASKNAAKEDDMSGILSYASAWQPLADDEVSISIELPALAGNEYQGLTTSITYAVEAIQGNAKTDGEAEIVYLPEGTYAELSATRTPADIRAAFRDVSANGGIIALNSDLSMVFRVSGYEFVKESYMLLNGYTYNMTYDDQLTVENGGTLTLKNGTINSKKSGPTYPAIEIRSGGEIVLDAIEMAEEVGGAIFAGGNTKVTVKNSTMYGWYSCICTNAGSSGNYNVDIEVENSTLEAACGALFVNVPSNVSVKNSMMIGDDDLAVLARGGNYVFENCKIVSNFESKYGNKDPWGSGNNVQRAALVVGNNYKTAWQYPTTCKLINTTVTANYTGTENISYPSVYIYGNATAEKGATLEFDEATQFVNGLTIGGGHVTVNGTLLNGSGTINKPYEELVG